MRGEKKSGKIRSQKIQLQNDRGKNKKSNTVFTTRTKCWMTRTNRASLKPDGRKHIGSASRKANAVRWGRKKELE